MSIKNILYITYDGLTDPLGQSQVLPYILKLSDQFDLHYTIVSFEKPDRYLSHKDRILELIRNKRINWVPLKYHRNPPILSKIIDLYLLRRKVIQICKNKGFHMVHARSYQAAQMGVLLKKRYNIPYLFDMRGYWIEERIEGGIWNMKNPFYLFLARYYKQKEQTFLKSAEHIISLTEASKSELLKRNLNLPPISVIPCSVDSELFDLENEMNKPLIRKSLNINSESIVLGYLGSLGTWYLLNEMLLLFLKISEKYKEAIFLFLTPEPEDVVYQYSDKLKIPRENLRILFVPRQEIPVYLSIINIGVCFIKPTFSKLASSPTKLGEMLVSGIPVIANDIGDVPSIINDNNGFLIRSFNDHSFTEALKKLESLLNSNSIKIRHNSLEYFDISHAIDSYKQAYENILDTKLLPRNSMPSDTKYTEKKV
jgi:glycosyltransferase involved in cell wall biosynthesis